MAFVTRNSTDDFVKWRTNEAHVTICNDSTTDSLIFSFDGILTDGVLFKGEIFDGKDLNKEEIYIKSFTSGNSVPYRIFSNGDTKIIYPEHPKPFERANTTNLPTNIDKKFSQDLNKGAK